MSPTRRWSLPLLALAVASCTAPAHPGAPRHQPVRGQAQAAPTAGPEAPAPHGGYELLGKRPKPTPTPTVKPSPTPTPAPTASPTPAPTPSPTPSGTVAYLVDAAARTPISRLIYGENTADYGRNPGATLDRAGGNRWTAYNWENNASNAGADWYHQNDGYLSASDVPGEAVRARVAAARGKGAGIVVTVPMAGPVAADKRGDGDVANSGSNYLSTRFRAGLPRKGAPFALAPDVGDAAVYQDEFVHWLGATFPGAAADATRPILFSLDNEPDLWSETHPRIHPDKATYAELATKTADYAAAIKGVLPEAKVLGPVSYGWNGFTSLQEAPDAAGRDFLATWLAKAREAEVAAGKRLVDVMDLHWYPEAQSAGGVRITADSAAADVAAARVQAPRSLWDPTYTEKSWITQWSTNGPIRLLPRMREKIAANYPGTALALTEYYYGGGADISGGIAQADALGVFGREGVYAANLWRLGATDHRFVYGAFAMFRNYDGAGSAFGDVGLGVTGGDPAKASLYASTDPTDGRLVVVAINKTGAALAADVAVANAAGFTRAEVYTLTAASATPKRGADFALGGGTFRYTMPAMSVSTLVLRP